jgi:hypothetical protein
MPRIQLVNGLAAILVIARAGDGRALVLVDPGAPPRRVLAMARPLLAATEREELARVLVG